MIHNKWLLLSTALFFTMSIKAQVKHNFKMNPENTDCHELPADLKDFSTDSIVNLITSKNYRFTQEMTLSRYRSPRALAYYSCDGSVGFMLAKETETQIAIYQGLPKTVWNTLINHKDPLGYYTEPTVKKYLISAE